MGSSGVLAARGLGTGRRAIHRVALPATKSKVLTLGVP